MRAFENGMTCLPIASPQHWEETIWGWLNLDTLTGKHGCFGAMRMRKWKWKSRRKRLYYSTTSSFSRRPNLWEDNLSWTEIQCEQSYQQYLCTLNLIASLFVTLYPSKELASVDIRGHLGREGWLNSEMSIIQYIPLIYPVPRIHCLKVQFRVLQWRFSVLPSVCSPILRMGAFT